MTKYSVKIPLPYPLIPQVPSVLSVLPYRKYIIDNPKHNFINDDPKLRKQVTEKIYKKICNSWLIYHYDDLLKYLKIKDNKVSLIDDIKNLDNDKNNNEMKFKFILNYFITKNKIYKLICKFINDNNINWWDLKKHLHNLRSYIHYKIKNNIKHNIK